MGKLRFPCCMIAVDGRQLDLVDLTALGFDAGRVLGADGHEQILGLVPHDLLDALLVRGCAPSSS